ncbi:MAG: hypothetical protein V1720_18245 [bacterium]
MIFRTINFCAILIIFSFVEFSNCHAQKANDLSGGVIYISNFIASDYFYSLKNDNNDLALVDTLFNRSYIYFDGDISEALLALTFACLPYNKMPLKLPLLNIRVDIPLPSVEESIFQIKIKNLPSHLLYDSPENEFGDKDKIPHFFGNAFLSYNISFINLAKFASVYVELFESSFAVEGAVSLRDMRVNQLGELFGAALKNNINLKPSTLFSLYQLYFSIF